jgi:hypothetical protein
MLCKRITLYLFNCTTEPIYVTESPKYIPRGPQPALKGRARCILQHRINVCEQQDGHKFQNSNRVLFI